MLGFPDGPYIFAPTLKVFFHDFWQIFQIRIEIFVGIRALFKLKKKVRIELPTLLFSDNKTLTQIFLGLSFIDPLQVENKGSGGFENQKNIYSAASIKPSKSMDRKLSHRLCLDLNNRSLGHDWLSVPFRRL